ncbi:MAG: nucleoside kinase [Pseudomonadota bacterium]
MPQKLIIKLNGKRIHTQQGVRVADILPLSPHKGKFPAIGIIINKRIDGLYYQIQSEAEIETIDLTQREGMDIYRRTLSLMLCAAMYELDSKAVVMVGQSLSDNYFFEIHNHRLSQTLLNKLEAKMQSFVQADISLMREWIMIEEAMAIFKQESQQDKIALLKQSRRSEAPLVKINNFHAIAYGPVAYTTKVMNLFKIHPYEHGLILGFPNDAGQLERKIPAQPKLFNTYKETKKWNKLSGATTITDLNEHCIKGSISELIKISEALHEKKISAIADEIAKRKNIQLILIAGPSGSGKTTFSKRLAIQLKLHGINPLSLSIDNYYLSRSKTPKHPDGTYDYECLQALDLPLLNCQLKSILQGKVVGLPKFNFSIGKRATQTTEVQLEKDQVIIMEGIHGLNEKLSAAVPRKNKYKIYVSALTQLSIDNHNRIFTTDTRLMRRIIRDRLFRGTDATETISIWPSVRAGEYKYIFPFQEDADVIFNSALTYEPALMKTFADRFLMEVDRNHPSFMEAARLFRFYSYLVPVLPRELPPISILREFIGGSAFRY